MNLSWCIDSHSCYALSPILHRAATLQLPDFSGVTSALDQAASISRDVEGLTDAVRGVSEALSLTTEEQFRAVAFSSAKLQSSVPAIPRFDLDGYANRLLVGVGDAITRRVAGQIQSLVQVHDGYRRQFANIGQQLTVAISKAVRVAFDEAMKIDWEAVQQKLAALAPNDQKALREALASAGLLPAPTMSQELGERVVLLHSSGAGGSQIANAVSGRYSRSEWLLLDEVHQGWADADILRSRSRTMTDATMAMRHGLYTVVAPALVPLIEGIAADYLASYEGKRVKVKHGQIKTKLEDSIPFWVANSVGLGAVTAFLDFLEARLFENVDFERDASKVKRMSVLNRHVLLHGRSPAQATRMNGLRSFLLLDTLGAVVLVTDQP